MSVGRRGLRAVAQEKGVTSSQLALASLAQGGDVASVPGTKRRRYLEENVAASTIELSADELARLDESFPPGVAAGDRHRDMATVHR